MNYFRREHPEDKKNNLYRKLVGSIYVQRVNTNEFHVYFGDKHGKMLDDLGNVIMLIGDKVGIDAKDK